MFQFTCTISCPGHVSHQLNIQLFAFRPLPCCRFRLCSRLAEVENLFLRCTTKRCGGEVAKLWQKIHNDIPWQGSLSLGFLVLGFTVQRFTLIKLGVLNGSLCMISSKAPRMGCLLYFQTPQGICFCQERRLTTKVFASLRKDSSTSCKASRRKNIQHAQTPVDDEGKQEGPRASSESACCSYS